MSPSTSSSNRFKSNPVVSFSINSSHSDPQITLTTFQPAPLKAPSSSCITFEFPRTGPSSRCRLQFITNIKLSSFSLDARVIAPKDSGSSISPSPRKAKTFLLVLSLRPRSIKYRINLA